MSQPDLNNESVVRRSRRFKWLVLGGFALAALLTLAGVLFIPWDVKPPEAPDLEYHPPVLKPEQNALTYFDAADKLMVSNFKTQDGAERDWKVLRERIGSPDEQWDLNFVDEILAANVSVFPVMEKGLACQDYASPPVEALNVRLPWVTQNYHLVSLLSIKSKRAHLAGDYAVAAKAGLQELWLGHMMTANPGCLLEWLVGIACEQSFGFVRLEELVADAGTPEPVLREILVDLNHWRPQDVAKGYCQALRVEYQNNGKALQGLGIEKTPRKAEASDIVVREMAGWPYSWKPNMTWRMMVPFYRNLIANADCSFAQAEWDYPGKLHKPVTDSQKVIWCLSPNSAGKNAILKEQVVKRAFLKKKNLESQIPALRLKIALCLYERKHGQMPDDLDSLVPEFMQEIPRDPYDDQPFRYSKEGKKVWAIGSDLIDENGSAKDDAIMVDYGHGYDLVMPLGTRELKPKLAPIPTRKGSPTP
jgi:hypothetical protein